MCANGFLAAGENDLYGSITIFINTIIFIYCRPRITTKPWIGMQRGRRYHTCTHTHTHAHTSNAHTLTHTHTHTHLHTNTLATNIYVCESSCSRFCLGIVDCSRPYTDNIIYRTYYYTAASRYAYYHQQTSDGSPWTVSCITRHIRTRQRYVHTAFTAAKHPPVIDVRTFASSDSCGFGGEQQTSCIPKWSFFFSRRFFRGYYTCSGVFNER